MNKDDIDRENHLEKLDRKLYGNSPESVPAFKRSALHDVHQSVPRDWSHPQTQEPIMMRKSKGSFFKRFFLTSLVFFLIALAFGLFQFFSSNRAVSNDNIDVSVIGNSFTPGGEELPLSVEIANRNKIELQLVDLIVEYPKTGLTDTTNTDQGNLSRTRISIGNIAPGENVVKDVPVTLYGSEGSTRDVTFTVEYHIPDSAAIFQKQKTYTVTLSSSPVAVSTEGGDAVVPNQPYTFTVVVNSNTKKPIDNMLVRVDYPTGFDFKSATPATSFFNNIWAIPELTPGEPFKIQITGNFLGQNGEDRSFRIYTGTQDATEAGKLGIVFNSMLHTVALSRPFIETATTVNGQTTDTVSVSAGSDMKVDIAWKTNAPLPVRDAEIVVKIDGESVDRTSIQPFEGFYDSTTDTITWNKNTKDDFKQVDPGSSGVVSFVFKPLKDVITADPKTQDTNLTVSIKGIEPNNGDTVSVVDAYEKVVIKYSSTLIAKAESLFASGPIKNVGTLPPIEGQKLTYTVHWVLSNTTNTLSNIEARAALPQYVTYTGVFMPKGENVVFDQKTNEVVWKVPELLRGAGVTDKVRDVYFQVQVTPSLSQVGTAPDLIKEGKVTGTDTNTTKVIQTVLRSVTTEATADASYVYGTGKVKAK